MKNHSSMICNTLNWKQQRGTSIKMKKLVNSTPWRNFRHHAGSKRPDKTTHVTLLPLYEIQAQAKLIYVERNQRNGCLQRRRLIGKACVRGSAGVTETFSIQTEVVAMWMYTFVQNSLSSTLNICEFHCVETWPQLKVLRASIYPPFIMETHLPHTTLRQYLLSTLAVTGILKPKLLYDHAN